MFFISLGVRATSHKRFSTSVLHPLTGPAHSWCIIHFTREAQNLHTPEEISKNIVPILDRSNWLALRQTSKQVYFSSNPMPVRCAFDARHREASRTWLGLRTDSKYKDVVKESVIDTLIFDGKINKSKERLWRLHNEVNNSSIPHRNRQSQLEKACVEQRNLANAQDSIGRRFATEVIGIIAGLPNATSLVLTDELPDFNYTYLLSKDVRYTAWSRKPSTGVMSWLTKRWCESWSMHHIPLNIKSSAW